MRNIWLKKKENTRNGDAGFTLIELMLYAGLVAIVTTAIGTMLVLTLQSRAKQQVLELVEQTGAIVLSDITQEIRNADSVETGTDQNENPTLTITPFDSSRSPIVYAIEGSQLTKTVGVNPAVDLTPSSIEVENLAFSLVSSEDETRSAVDIDFDLQTNPERMSAELQLSRSFFGTAVIRTP